MEPVDTLLDRMGRRIATRLDVPCRSYQPYTPPDPAMLRRTLRPADVLLIEGNHRLAAAIKYLMPSTWPHAALYVGDALGDPDASEAGTLIEANVGEGFVPGGLTQVAPASWSHIMRLA